MRLHFVDFVIFLPLKNRKANIYTDRVYCLTPVRFRTTWPKIADNIARQFISGLQLIHAFSFVLGVQRVTLCEGEVKTLLTNRCYALYDHWMESNATHYTYLPTPLFSWFFSSFPPSPKLFVAETTNSYSLPFSKLTTTLRSDVSIISFLRYTVYWVIGAPLFSASFHLKVILTSFVLAGKSVISAAAGTPGLKDEWYKVKKKKRIYFQFY